MRALARKAVVQGAARYLEVDIKAAGISTGPAATTPAKPGRKAAPAPAPVKSRPAAPARSAPSRKAPARAAASSRKKAAPPQKAGKAARPAVAPAKGRRAAGAGAARRGGAASAQAPAIPAREKVAEQAGPVTPVNPENAPSGIPGDEIAEALLAHVEIEPGQGIEDLALAMGTPAADLQEPIKKLLDENKITEEMRQGQASYYPT
ncbi:hypothetical protein WMF18_17755 [Sorangium sp. So ce315]|uniref:hypothetical protein n=1 Tax=Sorangium sp. So ce315 TaxID=3133299 RepID=UPI003F5D678B